MKLKDLFLKFFTKENLKIALKESTNIGLETATESTKSFINGIFYKIIFIIILIGTLLIGGCVGTELIVDMIKGN